MPPDRAGEDFGFLEKFLDIVFAEVRLQGRRRLVERENVVGRFEFGDGYESDLVKC